MFYIFYHVTLVMEIPHTLEKQSILDTTGCRYGTSTRKSDNHVCKCSNKIKHVAKEPYFKVYAFMTANNENKSVSYESCLYKMGFDTMNC